MQIALGMGRWLWKNYVKLLIKFKMLKAEFPILSFFILWRNVTFHSHQRSQSFGVKLWSLIHFQNFISLDFLPNSFLPSSSHSSSFLWSWPKFLLAFLLLLWALPLYACLNSWSYPCCCPFDQNMLFMILLQMGQEWGETENLLFVARFPKRPPLRFGSKCFTALRVHRFLCSLSKSPVSF